MARDEIGLTVIDGGAADEAKIIDIEQRRDRRSTKSMLCGHYRVIVDTQTRRVECKDCGDLIEPFDWLWMHSRERSSWKRYGEEIERRRNDLSEIERQIRNAKARLRRVR